MKRILFFALLVLSMCISTGMYAQSSAIDRYYEQYSDDDRFSRITVSSKMFSLFVNFDMDDPDEQELVEAISKLKGLKMLVGDEIADAKTIFKEVSSKPSENMDELMSVVNNNTEFRFFITESGGKISELLMLGHEGENLFMLSLVGEIDLKQIAALSRKMNIEGFEHFQNIDKG